MRTGWLGWLAALLLAAGALSAADISGKWSGFVVIEEEGEDEPIRAAVDVEFRQSGTKLAGSIGRKGDPERVAIQNGSVSGDRISFEAMAEEVDSLMRFTLRVSGDRILGEIRGKLEDGMLVGKVTFTRE
ncbi:MAG: hypothetical protein IPM24_09015 [Bryobacterales bacterium]|nr:hypothetical protein [Bryobacterales bacterium]